MTVSLILAMLVLTIFHLAGCNFWNQAPDPVKVREQVEAYRKQEQELVQSTIADPVRAERFLQLIADRDRLIASSTEAINTYRKDMSELNADFSAERESFESLIADYNARREAAQKRFVAIIGAMKSETTPEEWKTISRFQLRRLNPRRLTYGPSEEGG